MTCTRIYDSAAYVLGTLPADEVAEYERHLGGCAECQAEVAEFAGLPRLLSKVNLAEVEARWAGPTAVPADDDTRWAGPTAAPPVGDARWAGPTVVAPSPPPDNVLPMVLKTARRRKTVERRRSRLQTVGAALVAACLAGLAVFAVQRNVVTTPNDRPQPQLVSMQKVSATSPVSARVGVEAFPGGSWVVMECTYDGPDRGVWTFKMVVIPKYGTNEDVGSWMAGPGDVRTYPGLTKLKPEQIDKVELRKGDGTVLLVRDF
jgi:anti-sigma factor RsiW